MNHLINYIKNKSKVKLISLLMLLIVLIAAVVVLWDYFIIQKEVTLSPSPNTVIAVSYSKTNQPITKATSTEKIHLQPGTYTVRFTGTRDYQEESESVVVDKSITIKTPTLNYTDAKLSQLLATEGSIVHSVLMAAIPNTVYKINNEKLFETGNWYCAQLIPNDWYDPTVPSDYIPRPINVNNTLDMLKVIMKKGNDTWKPVAGPSIVFYVGDYPNIPPDIIRAANKLGF